ncbi:MAG: xanthine dehydrogenase molybdopterin binding subunit [Pirellulaceae bacterium]|nr:xanthine dehydrogenase molybdopterin binding subunit [Pirellulaceae bacterium]
MDNATRSDRLNGIQHSVAQTASKSTVSEALAHDSAVLHVRGQATYVDDSPEAKKLLHLAFGMSQHAHARILSLDLTAVRSSPDVVAVFTADDIPGENNVGPVAKDDKLLADGLVEFVGQPIFLVAARSVLAARIAAKLAVIEYEVLPAWITISDARTAGSLIEATQRMKRGEVDPELAKSIHRIQGSIEIGGQEHFYLEGQVAVATPTENRGMYILSSSQHPSEIQHLIARMLCRNSADVTVEVRRMGGAFGGKETQAALFAAAAALVADKTGQPAKFRCDRDDDMIVTGKRHDFLVDYDVGFDDRGCIDAIRLEFASRCGATLDLSSAINDRAMFHADNCYYLKTVEIISHRLKTHTVSNTAFRGFGGPQGMMAIERAMDAIAVHLEFDPLDVRIANFYRSGRDVTPYGMKVEDFVVDQIVQELRKSSAYDARRAEIAKFNLEQGFLKRGIALTPVKFGISFTTTVLNQAGALIHVYTDGSIQLNHGGTEMGQGLYIKVAQIVADVFGVPLCKVRLTSARTDKVPNTSATAASSGTDLNGMAAYNAATTIRNRIAEFIAARHQVELERIVFANGQVMVGNERHSFEEVCRIAYLGRVSLSSTGFYSTPKIHYDRATHQGRPFLYFAYGAAVSEVVIDTFTGESRVLRTDILHDAGRSINPAIDLGQVEGGFIQGMGWLTTEELVYDSKGRLLTHSPSTYKIPCASDRPVEMNIQLWKPGINREPTIHRSKAVGEPPLMLAISVFSAITQAIHSATGSRTIPSLNAPATPERVLLSLDK